MYLKRFTVQDVKCFGDVALDFCREDGQVKRWNVILGQNGTGKSTLLQAIAMTLIGPDPANRLQKPDGWVRAGCSVGRLLAEIVYGEGDQLTGEGRPRAQTSYEASYTITGTDQTTIRGVLYDRPTIVFDGMLKQLNSLKRGPWSEKSAGWFSAGYGPFRRLRGGSPDTIRLMYSGQKEARFVTLFREDAALEDLDDWLRELDHRSREEREESKQARQVRDVIQSVTGHLLPDGVDLTHIGPDGAFFSTPYSRQLPMVELSDGYRAMLALATDLLRRLEETFDRPKDWLDDQGKIIAEGVVLIDELDAHLHPVWQREIGFWLQERFPNMQFIVATHSPFVPQAADTDAIFVLHQCELEPDRVAVEQEASSVRGWRAEQILTVLFNLSDTRSPVAERKMRRYAELKALAEAGQPSLSNAQELTELSDWMNEYLSPPGDTPEEMLRYREIQQRVEDFLRLSEDSGDYA